MQRNVWMRKIECKFLGFHICMHKRLNWMKSSKGMVFTELRMRFLVLYFYQQILKSKTQFWERKSNHIKQMWKYYIVLPKISFSLRKSKLKWKAYRFTVNVQFSWKKLSYWCEHLHFSQGPTWTNASYPNLNKKFRNLSQKSHIDHSRCSIYINFL